MPRPGNFNDVDFELVMISITENGLYGRMLQMDDAHRERSAHLVEALRDVKREVYDHLQKMEEYTK